MAKKKMSLGDKGLLGLIALTCVFSTYNSVHRAFPEFDIAAKLKEGLKGFQARKVEVDKFYEQCVATKEPVVKAFGVGAYACGLK